MTTAFDTNVLAALLTNDPEWAESAQQGLERARRLGALLIAAPVYAELLATPGSEQATLDAFLGDTGISVDWRLAEPIWRDAALAYRGYAERRRAQRGDPGPRRILADFIIGAHAARTASALLTFDRGIYRAAFPALQLIMPSERD